MRKTEEIRNLIVADRENGETYAAIARKYKISISGAQKVFEKYKLTGNCKTLHGGGRKQKISIHEARLLKRKVGIKPESSARELKEELNLNVSERTIQRKLRSMGLKNLAAKKRPMISKNIIWSDESKFELKNAKRRKRVWCKQSDRLRPKFVQHTVKHGGGSIMVWGCFSNTRVGNLVKIDCKMTANVYVDILQQNLMESAEKMELGSFVFQQDNDPKHTSRIAKSFFENNGIQKLDWPAQSPDLNPIEHLWAILDTKISMNSRTNMANFWTEMQNQWAMIPPETLANLVHSIPNRLRAVIQNKGGNTDY